MLAGKGLGYLPIQALVLPHPVIDPLQCLGPVGAGRKRLEPLHGSPWIVGMDLGGVRTGDRGSLPCQKLSPTFPLPLVRWSRSMAIHQLACLTPASLRDLRDSA